MNRPIKYAPSILAADFTRLGDQIHAAEQAGAAQIHIDVMDGRFVPNLTMGSVVIEAARRSTRLPLDVHLMVVEPDGLMAAFRDAGADMMTVHVEACPNLHRTLTRIHELGAKAGVAINPHTPASLLSEIVQMVDLVLVMTVNPGFGGQPFIRAALPKITQVRAMCDATGRPIDVSVDGGINADTIVDVTRAGANVLVVGSAVYSDQFSVQTGFDALRATLSGKIDGQD